MGTGYPRRVRAPHIDLSSVAVKAEVLAKSLSEVANSLGVKTKAVISHMNHPLGLAVGNSLEVGLFQFNGMIRYIFYTFIKYVFFFSLKSKLRLHRSTKCL